MNENTFLNHPPEIHIIPGNKPLISPVYHSAKFTVNENESISGQFIYGRVSNPTQKQLEETLSKLQGKEDSIVVSSGIGALTGTFLGLLQSGDHILTFRELYKPGRVFIRDILPRYGISSTVIPLSEAHNLSQYIKPETKLIHFESPTNPHLSIADIDVILAAAKTHNVLVSMDGTFAGLHQHRNFDIDIVIHSLTKFGNGHGDVIAGCISGRAQVIKKIRETTMYLGAHLDPQAVYMIQRGLKTYMLRYQRQTETAHKVALYLQNHARVKNVYYPGLPEHKGHELAKKQMTDMGGVIAFEIAKDVAPSADAFCHKVNMIQLAASVGSTETIICPTLSFFGLDLKDEDRAEMGINSHTLRLSIGLEEAEDIIADLEEALR